MPKMQEINADAQEYTKGYIIEIKPKYLELLAYRIRAFFKYLFSYEVDEETGAKYHRAPRETADFSIVTKDFSVTWLGGDKYCFMVKRSPVVIQTNISGGDAEANIHISDPTDAKE